MTDLTGLPERLETVFGTFLTAVVAAICDFAATTNLPPHGLLAIGLQESSLDPNAVGDNGQSYGVFQIYLPAHGGAPETWSGLDGLERSMQEMRTRWVSTFAAAGGWAAFVHDPQMFLLRWAPAAQGSVPWTSAIAAQRLGQALVLRDVYLQALLAARERAGVRDALDGLTLAAQGLDELADRARAMAQGCRDVVTRYAA